jgi:hypothetical protein
MDPVLFLIAIMGCGEGDTACRQIRTLDTRYESHAACTAATEAAVAQNSDIEYPVVVAQCVAAGAAPASHDTGEVLLPPKGRAPTRRSPLGTRRS